MKTEIVAVVGASPFEQLSVSTEHGPPVTLGMCNGIQAFSPPGQQHHIPSEAGAVKEVLLFPLEGLHVASERFF